jgi:hypothetical protein
MTEEHSADAASGVVVAPPANGRRTFLAVLVNTAAANVTTSFLWFALTFWVYLETRSVLATGIVGGAYMLLLAVFAMVFGSLVDRHRKHRVMVVSGVVTLVAFLLAGALWLALPAAVRGDAEELEYRVRLECDDVEAHAAAGTHGGEGRIEHQGDAGKRLHRPVMEEHGDAAALVLLGLDQPLAQEPVARVELRRHRYSMIDWRSAIATAWVRVSASSFVRMWRTWLFTVSWLMKSFAATSAFDMPSARSWRISRSRVVSVSSSLPVRNAGMSAGST